MSALRAGEPNSLDVTMQGYNDRVFIRGLQKITFRIIVGFLLLIISLCSIR